MVVKKEGRHNSTRTEKISQQTEDFSKVVDALKRVGEKSQM